VPSERTRKKRRSYPRSGTPAAHEYFESHARITRFFNWLLFMTSVIDRNATIAHEALLDGATDEDRRKLEVSWASRVPMVDELKSHRQFLLEVIICRHVDNFMNYLASLLNHIFVQRHETLRSSDKVELVEVLRHDSLSSFIRAAAERKVEQLSYQSFADLASFFADRFGLEIVPEGSTSKIVEAIELRNISVHNRCVINRRYCQRTGSDHSRLGKLRKVYIGDLEVLDPLLIECVKKLDTRARRHLQLKGTRFTVSTGGPPPNPSLQRTPPG
jgi:hypothetical protein